MDPKPALPNLPVEALDHIFSFLRNDIPSLTACMSATPYFQAIGEKHLWHHFTLRNTSNPNRHKSLSRSAAQLSKILTDAPHLAMYIRSLEIIIAAPSVLEWFMTRSLNDEEMAPVLPLFSHLEHVSMVGGCISWDRLHQVFQAALMRTLCLPSVKEVTIEGVDGFPLSIFNRCTALKRLSLVRGNFSVELGSNLNSLHTAGTRPSLDSLIIRDTYSLLTIVDWLCTINSSPDITSLHSLSIAVCSVAELSYVAEILRACSDSLCELELMPSSVNLQYDVDNNHGMIPPDHPTPPPLSLSKMHSLRSLTIVGEIRTADEFFVCSYGEDMLTKRAYSTPLSWIRHLLETFPPALSHLTFDILFKVAYLGNLQWIRWAEFARALSAPHLAGLRRVELNVSFETTWDVVLKPNAGLEILRSDAHLSELIRSGLLVVHSRKKKEDVHVRL